LVFAPPGRPPAFFGRHYPPALRADGVDGTGFTQLSQIGSSYEN